jgi:superfamily II DNA or RNA helicase
MHMYVHTYVIAFCVQMLTQKSMFLFTTKSLVKQAYEKVLKLKQTKLNL